MHTLQSQASLSTTTSAVRIPETPSPIAAQLDTLAATLACAQEGLTLLYIKLEPVRAAVPTEGSAQKRPPSESQMESRLADLIDAAAFLNVQLSNLRGELRI
jgi:hypothetical protein